MPKKVCPTVNARKALNPIWKTACLKGRCWGPKGKKPSSFAGTNITFAVGSELVSISKMPFQERCRKLPSNRLHIPSLHHQCKFLYSRSPSLS